MDILLVTLNARFSHAALGLRYLKANLNECEDRAEIIEFTIQDNIDEMVGILYQKHPKIVSFGVYIWNIFETTHLIKDLKELMPDVTVIIGGPEVSYEYEETEIFNACDYLITGWGDISHYELCRDLLIDHKGAFTNKAIQGKQPPLADIKLPYYLYNEMDLQHKTIYVEASRGCPFKCEFCLSSMDKTAWRFPLESFLKEMEQLYSKGLRQFKFVDRTFNLKIDFTLAILDFFLAKIEQFPENALFLHFELVPDYLSDELKAKILQFPKGTLQFEIGIQTLNTTTQELISRRTDLVKAKANISWLSHHTDVHLHVDLIVGLPGENLESFAKGFNELWRWNPQEVQIGILKRLKGVPIARHTEEYSYKYSQSPPYSILENRDIPYLEILQMERFAKYWSTIANSGRFPNTLPIILGGQPFECFFRLSQWLFARFNRAHSIALDRLFKGIFEYLSQQPGIINDDLMTAMQKDFIRTGIQGWPRYLGERPEEALSPLNEKTNRAMPKRQQLHQ